MALEPPKMKSKGPGRKGIDFESLYLLWVDSGLTIPDFLSIYGLKGNSSKIQSVIKEWKERATDAALVNLEEKKNPVHGQEIWETIKKWRLRQGEEDYLTANALRQHIKVRLKKTLIKHADGTYDSALKSAELDTMSRTLLNVQKIQRLALGMSTDNVGVSHSSPELMSIDRVDSHEEVPLFIVEMNENGKFKRSRPRESAGDS